MSIKMKYFSIITPIIFICLTAVNLVTSYLFYNPAPRGLLLRIYATPAGSARPLLVESSDQPVNINGFIAETIQGVLSDISYRSFGWPAFLIIEERYLHVPKAYFYNEYFILNFAGLAVFSLAFGWFISKRKVSLSEEKNK